MGDIGDGARTGNYSDRSVGSVVMRQVVIGAVKEGVVYARCRDPVGAVEDVRSLWVTLAEVRNDVIVSHHQ